MAITEEQIERLIRNLESFVVEASGFRRPLGTQMPSHLGPQDVFPARTIGISLGDSDHKTIDTARKIPVKGFDTLTILNHKELQDTGKELWLYINERSSLGRFPLHKIKSLSTYGHECWLEYDNIRDANGDPFILEVLLGGDFTVMSIETRETLDIDGTVNANLLVEGSEVKQSRPIPVYFPPANIPVVKQGPQDASSQPWDVKLTGRKVSSQTVHARAVRSADSTVELVEVPDGAVGFAAFMPIYGRTGTFAQGEGVRMEVGIYANSVVTASPMLVDTERTSATALRSHVVVWYPGAQKGDAAPVDAGASGKVVGLPVGPRVWFQIQVNGTFSGDEGFDCELFVDWLY